MATRQYIGARYVPKIDGEWDIAKSYEALSIVTNMGASYTSKKPVPTGISITNTEYWALTGNYNEQVELYREEVESYVSKLNKVADRKYIFIGDSYGENNDYTSWITTVVQDLDLIDGVSYHKNSVTSTGFVANYNGRTFVTLLGEVANNLSAEEKETITDICVCGGFNDWTATFDDIKNAISSFISFAKSTFPNAVVYVGCIGWSMLYNIRANIRAKVIPAYSSVVEYGGIYIKNSEYTFHDYSVFKADGTHPNENGAKYIGHHIAEGLLKGITEVIRPRTTLSFDIDTSVSNVSNISNAWYVTQTNDITMIEPWEVTITLTGSSNLEFGRKYIIGDIACDFVRSSDNGLDYLSLPFVCTLNTNDGAYVCNGAIKLDDEKAYYVVYPFTNGKVGTINGVNSITLYTSNTCVIPTLMC